MELLIGLRPWLRPMVAAPASRSSAWTVLSRALVVSAVVAGLFTASSQLFLKVESIERVLPGVWAFRVIGSLLVDRAPTMGQVLNRTLLLLLLFSLTLMLTVSSIIAALGTFFGPGELELWFATPVRYRVVFTAKFLETLVDSSWMVALGLVPVLAAFGWVYQAPAAFYLTFWIPLVPFLLFPVALGVIVTLLVSRLVPARMTGRIARWLAVAAGAVVLVAARLVRPELLLAPEHLSDLLVRIHTPWNPHLEQTPAGWAVKEILWLLDFPLTVAPADHALLWGGALAVVGVAAWIARRFHRTAWQYQCESLGAPTPGLAAVDPGDGPLGRLLWPLSVQARALLVKDARIVTRSPLVMTQMVMTVVVVTIYIYNVRMLPLGPETGVTPLFIDWVAFVNIGFVALLVTALAVRFAFPAVSMEGPALHVIRASPVGMALYLRTKLAAVTVPLALLALVLVVASDLILGVRPWLVWVSVVDALLFPLVIGALALGLGAHHLDLRPQGVAALPASLAGMMYMVVTVAVIAVLLSMQGLPLYLHTRRKLLRGMLAPELEWLAWAAAAASVPLALWVSARSLRAGAAALEDA